MVTIMFKVNNQWQEIEYMGTFIEGKRFLQESSTQQEKITHIRYAKRSKNDSRTGEGSVQIQS